MKESNNPGGNTADSQAQLAAAQAAAEPSQYLTFMLGGEMFAIGILAIKEIIEYQSLTEVPMMPPCVRGVINLRGSVVPVIDLAARFGKPAAAVTKRTCIVIVEIGADGERQDVGVTVDAVNEVLEIPQSDIESAPSFGANIRTDFIEGMGKLNDRFIIILDTDHVLSVDDVQALSQLGETGNAAGAVAEPVAA
jgi:purine-binding chemotaxis protein CheW